MKITKDDKMMLRKEYAKVWGGDDGMVEHCVGHASGFLWLGDWLYVIDKPSIKTDFWFGEHTYDYDEVCERCDVASRDEDYFVKQNLRDCNAVWMLKEIEGTKKPYLCEKYSSLGGRMCYIDWRHDWESGRNEIRPLEGFEVDMLKQLWEEEVEKFRKRLGTYLKRYGLSKCHFGVYWADR